MSTKRVLLSITGLVAIAVLAVWWLLKPSAVQGVALNSREHAMQLLGARLAALKPGCKVLVLSNPFTQDSSFLNDRNRFEQAGVGGLRQGLGKGSTVKVVFPAIRPEYASNPGAATIPPDSKNPLSFLMAPASVEALAAANPECQVIVSLIGLPLGVEQLALWDEKDPRGFGLLLPDLRLLGPPEKTIEAFQRGKILAAVTEVRGTPEPLVVTRENVAEILERSPSALGY